MCCRIHGEQKKTMSGKENRKGRTKRIKFTDGNEDFRPRILILFIEKTEQIHSPILYFVAFAVCSIYPDL